MAVFTWLWMNVFYKKVEEIAWIFWVSATVIMCHIHMTVCTVQLRLDSVASSCVSDGHLFWSVSLKTKSGWQCKSTVGTRVQDSLYTVACLCNSSQQVASLASMATEDAPEPVDALVRAAVLFQPNRASYRSEEEVGVSELSQWEWLCIAEVQTAHLHRAQSKHPASRWVSPMTPCCCGAETASAGFLGWTQRCCSTWIWCLWGWHRSRLSILGWCCTCFLLQRGVLGPSENRGGVREWWNWPRGTAGGRTALLRGTGGSGTGSLFLSSEGVDPAGTVSGGEGGQGQRREPHVLPWGDQLSKALLVGKGIAGPPRTTATAQTDLWRAACTTPGTANTTTPWLPLLLPHQLSVTHLEDREGQCS